VDENNMKSFAYFYAYAWVRGSYIQRTKGEISTMMELVLGAVAAAATQMVTLPISVITTRYEG
jgi:hypothetical protein